MTGVRGVRGRTLVLAVAVALAGAAAPERAVADEPAPAAAAAAEPARAQAIIALLPLAAERKLSIYGQPVAAEVARALEQRGFTIEVVGTAAPVPAKARLVIDGRIVRGDGGAILLEARVRDPALGTVVASLSATAPSLTRIDEGAGALVAALEPVLRDGLAAQDRAARRRAAIGGGGGARGGDAEGTRGEPDGDGAHAARRADARPLAVVSISSPSSASASADSPALEPLLFAGAERLAGLVGHRATRARTVELATARTTQGAALGVAITLLAIDYDEGGVITARARARVHVIDGDGVVFSRVVRTDTLVGGRGDRKDAVARAAIDQIVDIAYGRVRDALAEAP